MYAPWRNTKNQQVNSILSNRKENNATPAEKVYVYRKVYTVRPHQNKTSCRQFQ